MQNNKGKSSLKNSIFIHNSKKYLNNLSNLFTEDIILKIEKLANHLKKNLGAKISIIKKSYLLEVNIFY